MTEVILKVLQGCRGKVKNRVCGNNWTHNKKKNGIAT